MGNIIANNIEDNKRNKKSTKNEVYYQTYEREIDTHIAKLESEIAFLKGNGAMKSNGGRGKDNEIEQLELQVGRLMSQNEALKRANNEDNAVQQSQIQSLVDQNEKLQREIKLYREKSMLNKTSINKTQSEASARPNSSRPTVNEAVTCIVCYESYDSGNHRRISLQPCGHMIGFKCHKEIGRNRCPYSCENVRSYESEEDEDTDAMRICVVCENTYDDKDHFRVVLRPCGHMLGSKCHQSWGIDKCPYSCGRVDEAIKLQF